MPFFYCFLILLLYPYNIFYFLSKNMSFNFKFKCRIICIFRKITINLPALSKESSGILLLFLTVRPTEQMLLKLYLHLKAQTDSIGHVLRMCNEVLEFSFCFLDKQGSNNDVLWVSLVMTFVNYLLRIQNHWVNLNQIWNKRF